MCHACVAAARDCGVFFKMQIRLRDVTIIICASLYSLYSLFSSYASVDLLSHCLLETAQIFWHPEMNADFGLAINGSIEYLGTRPDHTCHERWLRFSDTFGGARRLGTDFAAYGVTGSVGKYCDGAYSGSPQTVLERGEYCKCNSWWATPWQPDAWDTTYGLGGCASRSYRSVQIGGTATCVPKKGDSGPAYLVECNEIGWRGWMCVKTPPKEADQPCADVKLTAKWKQAEECPYVASSQSCDLTTSTTKTKTSQTQLSSTVKLSISTKLQEGAFFEGADESFTAEASTTDQTTFTDAMATTESSTKKLTAPIVSTGSFASTGTESWAVWQYVLDVTHPTIPQCEGTVISDIYTLTPNEDSPVCCPPSLLPCNNMGFGQCMSDPRFDCKSNPHWRPSAY